MPKCKRCGSSDIVERKGQLRCSVCDQLVATGEPKSGSTGVTSASRRPPKKAQSPKWEYFVLWAENAIGCSLVVLNRGNLDGEDIDVAFDALGEDGWELVTNGTKPSLFGPMRKKTYFVFKKEGVRLWNETLS